MKAVFHFGLFVVGMSTLGAASAQTWKDYSFYDLPPKDWRLDQSTGCYSSALSEYNELVKALAIAALGRADTAVGCVTYPYLQAPYDEDGSLGIRNLAHAGIDLRAKEVPVYAIHDGVVEDLNLCVVGPAADQPQCTRRNPKDLTEVRSTLVIEDGTRTYKSFYLHLKQFDTAISKGSRVRKGARLGVSGDVGAKGRPHLHLEVRPSWTPGYCEAKSAIGGSACRQETARPMRAAADAAARLRTDYCTRDDLMRMSADPVIVFQRLSTTPVNAVQRLTTASPVFLRAVGPVQVGMTLAEAERASSAPFDAEFAGSPGDVMACGYPAPRYGPGGIKFMLHQGRIARIDIDSCRFATRSGIRVGDSEEAVKSAYPGIQIGEHQYNPDGHYLSLGAKDPADAGAWLVFETDGKKVTTFRVGKEPEVNWVEGCF